ncbi:MAG: InlB B-repeat-containing protein [Proteobacteria bacterium]|nr:InlB B-repeat-containing protein [Candidatus Enterousia scatequi]
MTVSPATKIETISVRNSALSQQSPSTTQEMDNKSELLDYCKKQYSSCMDEYCNVLDENMARCSCSANLKNYTETSAALEQATDALQEVAQQIQYIGLSAKDIETLFTETEAEMALSSTTDSTQLKNDLSKIKKMIVDIKPTSSASTTTNSGISVDLSGLLSFDINADGFNLDSMFGNTTNTASISNLRGVNLYKTGAARCKENILTFCKENGISENLVTNTYDLQIDQDCLSYERYLESENKNMAGTVRSAENVLRKARLMVRQNANAYDLRGCVTALDECMRSDFVCGSDYENCLDPTGKYIVSGNVILGSTPGQIGDVTSGVYETWFYDTSSSPWDDGNLSSYIQDNLLTEKPSESTSSKMAKYLQYRIGYYDTDKNVNYGLCMGVLNQCQDYTYTSSKNEKKFEFGNVVIREYLNRILPKIKQKQDEVLETYAQGCVAEVKSCLTANGYGTTSDEIAKNACQNVIKTCANITSGTTTSDDTTTDWIQCVMNPDDSGCTSGGSGTGSSTKTCPPGRYLSGTTCIACGKGYYKAGTNADTSCSPCSGKPTNSEYTSTTASTSSCPWECRDGYTQSPDGNSCVIQCAPGYSAETGRCARSCTPDDLPSSHLVRTASGTFYQGDRAPSSCKVSACVFGYRTNLTKEYCVPENCLGGTYRNYAEECSVCPGDYNKSDSNATDASGCYKDCAKQCTCPSNATCSYSEDTTVTGKEYYNQSCNAVARVCPASAVTCVQGYSKNSEGKCIRTACTTTEYLLNDVGCQPCPGGASGTDSGATSAGQCYKKCDSKDAIESQVYYDEASQSYPECGRKITCGAGQRVKDQGTANPTCVACPQGSYNDGDNDTDACTPCLQNGQTAEPTATSGAKTADACYLPCNTADFPGAKNFTKGSSMQYSTGLGKYTTDNCYIATCEGTTSAVSSDQKSCIATSCPTSNTYLANGKCESCPDSHPSSDANSTGINSCYRSCQTGDVQNATSYTTAARFYYNEKTGANNNSCTVEACSGGLKPSGSACVTNICEQDQYNDNGTCKPCPNSSPYSVAGSASIEYCYRKCGSGDIENAASYTNNSRYYYDGTNSCEVASCNQGYSVQNNKCVESTCNDGEYKNNNGVCIPCPDQFPKIDNPGDTSKMCYHNCTSDDVDNADTVTGKFYYGDERPSSCQAVKCKNGENAVDGSCSPVFNITLNPYGGSYNGNPTAITVTYSGGVWKLDGDDLKGVLPVPTKEGYKFTGYNTSNKPVTDASGKIIDNYAPMTATTLTAQWTFAVYTLTLEVPTGVTCDSECKTKIYYGKKDGKDTFSYEQGLSVPVSKLTPLPKKDGSVFAGYARDGNVFIQKDGTIILPFEVTTDLALQIQWEGKQSITYHMDGGSCDKCPSDCALGTQVTLQAPTKKDFTFQGWYNSSGSKQDSPVACATLDLYAYFTEDSSSVCSNYMDFTSCNDDYTQVKIGDRRVCIGK